MNSLANMRLADFEQLGKQEYNKGFAAALTAVIKLLDTRVCEDFNADGSCEHDACPKIAELAEGIINAKNNVGQ